MTIKQDILRYHELSNSSFFKEPSSILICLFRFSGWINKIKIPPLRILLNILLIPLYRFISVFLGISLPRSCKIGSGLVIFHFGAIAINELVVIGENCTIRQGVTIGNKNTSDDVPIIGDNVDIGVGAVIIGKIRIGNNVCIGANAVVLKDVPDNHMAIGVPAKIVLRKQL